MPMRVMSVILTAALFASVYVPSTAYAETVSGEEEASSSSPVVVTDEAVAGAEATTVVNLIDTGGSNEPPLLDEDMSSGSEVTDEASSVLADTSSSTASERSEIESTEEQEAQQDTENNEEPLDELTPMVEDYEDVPLEGGSVASSTNEAVVTNSIAVSADSGGNSAEGDSGAVVTGNAIAYANVVNLINTNIVNSNGFMAFMNHIAGTGMLDLRDAFDIFAPPEYPLSTDMCSYDVCGGTSPFSVFTTSTTSLTNDIEVGAVTGGNTVGDDGLIVTGNAYAAANVFNVANTDIIDSNYILIAFNNFGDYAGDIILPSGETLAELFDVGGLSYAAPHVNISNEANIHNSVSVEADSGNNEAVGGVVATGDTYADTTVHNVINTTEIGGGTSFLMVLRIHGSWSGNVFNLPNGITWDETPHGIVLYGAQPGNANQAGTVHANLDHEADITNNVVVYALSGENRAGTGGEIQTGDAYAASNITNVANTSIIGENWALLMFDIFGNWEGDLSFGAPDLWVGGKASPSRNPLLPGGGLTYTYTISNNGDVTATGVTLKHVFSNDELALEGVTSHSTGNQNEVYGSWPVGSLAPGESKTVTVNTTVNPELGPNLRSIETLGEVSANEPDGNESDNTERLTVLLGSNARSSGGSLVTNVVLTKESSADTTFPGGMVDYTITVTNKGSTLYDAILRDILKDENGTTVSEQYWELGTIRMNEVVTIAYTTEFSDTSYGSYTNTAEVGGARRAGTSYVSSPATHTIYISGPSPMVAGVSTSVCTPFLTSYMRSHSNNDSKEVTRLQSFLNMHMRSALPLTGTYDMLTEIAVRAFQTRYADTVLVPWGLTQSTGIVYYTTQKKVNDIVCAGKNTFPYTITQLKEISRSYVRNLNTVATR